MAGKKYVYFDYAGVGRPSARAQQMFDAYNWLDRCLPKSALHQVHIGGFDRSLVERYLKGDLLDVLSGWAGGRAFEWTLQAMLGLNSHPWVVDYGRRTVDLFSTVLESVSQGKAPSVLVDNCFYSEWRGLLDAGVFDLRLQTVDIKQHLLPGRGSSRAAVVTSILSELRKTRPTLLLLTQVTRGGLRMPVDELLSQAHAERLIDSDTRICIDGCQGFGRCAIDLGNGILEKVRCSYIGCFHKAMAGPKDMGFLVCTDGSWAGRLRDACDAFTRGRGVRDYFRSAGAAPALPTVGCANVVVAGCLVAGMNLDSLRLRENVYRGIEGALRTGLGRTDWRVAGPDDDDEWFSGVLRLIPPSASLADIRTELYSLSRLRCANIGKLG